MAKWRRNGPKGFVKGFTTTAKQAHAGGADKGTGRRGLAPSRRQAGQAEQARQHRRVGDHFVARPVKMVEACDQHGFEHGHVRRPDMRLHDGADAPPPRQAIARVARLPVDAEEAHPTVDRIDEPDAEIDQ